MDGASGDRREPWARAILEQNRRWLVAYFIAATGDPSRAEDLCQDVFAAALKNASQFDPSKSFGAWLRGIARNVLLMHFRQSRHRVFTLDEAVLDRLDRAAAHAEAAHAVPEYSDLRLEVLRECLRSLPVRGRAVLGLKYSKDLPSRRIGESVGMKTTAVDMMLSRARRMLQECVQRKMASVARG